MLDGTAIQKKIPHRYPFLLLDGVHDQSETQITGFKNVTVNEPHFQGHFPSAPVMPGVLVLESLVQLSWLMFEQEGGVCLSRIRKLRFRRPTVPGDRLELAVEVIERDEKGAQLKAQAKVEEQMAVSATLWVEFRKTYTDE